MPKWSEIPVEIINIIFFFTLKKITKVTIPDKRIVTFSAEYALTCRGWRNSAQEARFFFSKIVLHTVSDVERLFHCLGSSMYLLRGFVRRVEINASLNILVLSLLAMLVPMVEDLIFICNENGDNGDEFYSAFSKLVIENGKFFDRLKCISIPRTTAQDQLFVQCLDALKDRFNSIELLDEVTALDHSETSLYSNLCKKLFQFL